MADPRLQSILDRSGDAATVAWAHDGEGSLAALPDAELAIAAAVQLGNVAALLAVESPKPLRKLAAAGLHKLKSRGVVVEQKAATNSFSLGRETLDVPPRAFLSGPNELGNHHLVLTATDFDGSCIMELIVGGDKVEDRHGHASRHELRSFWKEMEKDREMRELPFVAGLHLADAAAAGQNLHGWGHFISKVAPATLATARLVDPLRYALADDGRAPAHWVLPAWLVPGTTITALAEQIAADEEALNAGAVEAAVDDAVTDEVRLRFANAANLTAEVFALLGYAALAESARDVGVRLRSGDSGNAVPQLRAAMLLAAFKELNHRQREKQAEIDDMMRMIGQQSGE